MTDDEGDQRADKSRHRAVSSATLTVTTDRTDTRMRGGIDPCRPGDVEHNLCDPSPARVPSNHWRPRHMAPSRAPAAAHPRVLRSCRRASTLLASRASLCMLPRPGDRSRHKSRRAACAMCSDNTDGVPLCCRLSSRNHISRSSATRATRNAGYSTGRNDPVNLAAIWSIRLQATRPGANMPGSGRLP